jgi:predicted membrane protein
MERQPSKARLPLWHSLMYSTGILLIVGGIPGAIATSFLLMFGRDHIDRSDALRFGCYMIGAEVVIAVVLLYFAKRITKHRHKICIKNDDTDA